MNQIYISDVTGSRGCHNADDISRAVSAAEAALEKVDAAAAMRAYVAKINDEPHNAMLAAVWARAEREANAAFTEGWAVPGGVMVSLEAR